MVDIAKAEYKNDLKRLWKLAFKDTDEYVDFYFTKRFRPECTVIYKEDNKIVSSAQVHPYEMTYLDTLIKTEYILGVCTNKDYRKKGYAGEILKNIVSKSYSRNILVQTLIPQEDYLFNIYEKYGFIKMFDITKKEVINPKKKSKNVYLYEDSLEAEVYKFYTDWYKSASGRVIKSLDDFKFVLEESLITKSIVYVYKESKVEGFALLDKHTYEVKEILYTNDGVKQELIKKTFELINKDKIQINFPSKSKKSYGLGMARVINVNDMLKIYAKNNPLKKFTVKIQDNIIKENNHIYTVENSKITVDTVDKYDFLMNIKEFTEFILGYKTVESLKYLLISAKPYMNLMLN